MGGQSTGKSSLLQSLTDIPFPVGTGCCTRFATRIVSRRTAPGTLSNVKITIDPPTSDVDYFGYPPNDAYKRYSREMTNLNVDEFAEIIDQVADVLGITKGQGKRNKNFATEVLKIELSGPGRSHFSILDIPGIFSHAVDVNHAEMKGIKNMVIDYMKKSENIVM